MINGLDIQFLDGVENTDNAKSIVDYVLKGYDKATIDNIDTLVNGYDLAGFQGDGSVSDSEKLHSYILRTKVVADKYPQAITGYQNPEQFSQMLGFVLGNWDTANRESAIENMVREEERLIGIGAIKQDIAEDSEVVEIGDVDDIENYEHIGTVIDEKGQVKKVLKTKKGKAGFFRTIQKLNNNANISNDANEIVNANPYLNKYKTAIRKKIAEARKLKNTSVVDSDTKKTKVIAQHISTATDGLNGIDDDVQAVLLGYDFYENLNGVGTDAIKNYLKRTHSVLKDKEKILFKTRNQADVALGSIEYALQYADDKDAFEKSLNRLSGENATTQDYNDMVQEIARNRRQNQKRSFFNALKKATKTNKRSDYEKAVKINPYVKPVKNATKVALLTRQLNGLDELEMLGGFNGVNASKTILKNTIDIVKSNPSVYSEDAYEHENTIGTLTYALDNWSDGDAVSKLCGVGIGADEYDEMEDSLGAMAGKKTLAVKKAQKIARAKAGKIDAMKKAYVTTSNETLKKKLAEKLAEAQKNSLGAKVFKKVAKAVKKSVTAPVKATAKVTKAVAKGTAKVAKKTGTAVKKAAKKTGQVIKKATKKTVKFLIKYNPVTLVARSVILMACSLNMFKMAERLFPATLAENEALKYGISTEQYNKSKDAYSSLKKSFTKMGGNESKLKKYLEKGSKKVWKGGDSFDKKELLEKAKSNLKNINKMVEQDEADLKKSGATSTTDPNVSYIEQKVEVEEQATAVNGLLGLIENGYIIDGVNGLGVVTEATVATGTATASGVLTTVLGKLKNIFASGKVKEAVKNTAKKVGEKTKEKLVNSKDKIVETVSNAKDKVKEKVVDAVNTDAVKNFTETAKNVATATASNFFNKYSDESNQAATETTPANSSQNSSQTKQATSGSTALIVGIGAVALLGIGTAIYLSSNKNNE